MEWREVYAQLSDAELIRAFHDLEGTQPAPAAALKAEIERRKLRIPPKPITPKPLSIRPLDPIADMNWKMRFAVVVSALWVLIALLFAAEDDTWGDGFYWPKFVTVLLPLVTLWGLGWIIAGVKNRP